MRLIDAGLLLDHLSGRLESMKDYDAIKDVVNNMPTAYDVDEVIEKLERISVEEPLIADGIKVGTIKVLVLKNAVEIVKGGESNDK